MGLEPFLQLFLHEVLAEGQFVVYLLGLQDESRDLDEFLEMLSPSPVGDLVGPLPEVEHLSQLFQARLLSCHLRHSFQHVF